MTYRERLLEKVKFRLADNKAYEVLWRMGAESEGERLTPIITALLDECERLDKALQSILFEVGTSTLSAKIASQAVVDHATAMEKLCGEGE